MSEPRVILSNGGYKFHLGPLAVELQNLGVLSIFITAGWPSGWQRWIALKFPNSPSWRRLLDRKEPLNERLVKSIGLSELFFKGADSFLKKRSILWHQRVHCLGFRFYAYFAKKTVSDPGANIYHYRNCYGRSSVEVARKSQKITLCDHSIGHPICLHWMENHEGEWPKKESFGEIYKSLPPTYRAMAEDLKLGDHVLVNSDFVKDTCIYVGMDPSKVHVVYLGVDEGFFKMVDEAKPAKLVRSDKILFAGGWQLRKGVTTLVKSLQEVDVQWSLEIAGGIDPTMESSKEMALFFSLENVDYLGTLSRSLLAETMKSHRIMVFPSYCEGSARVIFEALCAGCYIITTRNSGSIVEDGVHGRIVSPGNVLELAAAIKYALTHPEEVERIGNSNARLVRESYRQADFGQRVLKVYSHILERSNE